jgi:isopentenyldiphosphate isomerase
MVEYFDVVDEQDRPTGKLTTKAEAHADGTIHRLVAIYVFDKDGRLYVQDHKASGLLDHSVGGHVAAGEDYVAAAIREGEEELSLVNQQLQEVFTGLYSDERFDLSVQTTVQVHQFGIFECSPTSDWLFAPNDEVETITPMEVSEVVRLMNETPGRFTPGFINTMAKYLEVKRLPYSFDHASIRRKWGSTV